MSTTWRIAALAAGVGVGAAAPAYAVEAVKVGVLAHNICISACKNADKEDGPIVDVQVNFRGPGFLKVIGTPSPYLAASPNVSGDPSFAAAGLEWRWGFAEGWSVSPGFGYAVHNGETQNKFPNGNPAATKFAAENVLYGSRDLFRSSLALGRDLGANWGLEAVYVHYSHGQILGNGRNQGVDQAGLRVAYRFGG